MAGYSTLPTILLACTNQARDGKHAVEAVEESEKIAAILHPFEMSQGCHVIEARYGSRSYFTDVLTQKQVKENVRIVHLISGSDEEKELRFRTRSGESVIEADELAEALRAFPKLQLLILSGNIHPDFSEVLLRAAAAPVLLVPPDNREALQYFYDALLDGERLNGAYDRMVKAYGEPFSEGHNLFDYSKKGWAWDPEGQKPSGLWTDQGVADFLRFQLRNPLLIPITERPPITLPPRKKEMQVLEPKPPVNRSEPAEKKKPQPAQRPKRKSEPLPQAETTVEEGANKDILQPNPAQRPETDKPERRRQSVRSQQNRNKARQNDPQAPPRKKRWLWIAAAVVSLGAALYVSYPGWQQWFGSQQKACLFPQDEQFHILVLPFSDQSDCLNEAVEKRQMLMQQLDKLTQQGFRFTARYYDLGVCAHTESALSLMAENCDADLVLWAFPQDHERTGEQMLTYRFIGAEGQAPNPFINASLQVPFYEARGTGLSQPVENVIFWALAQRSLRDRRFQDAIEAYGHIQTEEPGLQSLVWAQLAQSHRLAGHYEQARELYDRLITLYPEENRYLYERANLLTKLGVYDSALHDYGLVLEAEPDNANALISRGVLYREQGNYDAALTDFNRVLNNNPDFSPVYCSRAEVYEALQQYGQALSDYNRALRVSPDYVGALYGRARLKQKIGQQQEALADIRRALELEPDYTDALLFQGDILLDDRQYNEALLAYTQVLADFKSARAYMKRGHVYRLLREYPEAIEDLKNATRLDPTLAVAWREAGMAYASQQKNAEAFENFDKAIQLAPTDAESYYVRADLYNELDREDEALADYQKAISIRPRNAVAHYKQGELFYKQAKYRQALEAINQALRLDPQQADALVVRGKVYQALDNPRQALNDWQQALRLDPNQAEAYYLQGRYQLEQGNKLAGLANVDRAIQLNTSAYEAYVLRAHIYSEEKDYQRALELYSEALRINPDQPEVYYIRADYYLRLKQYAKALADYNQAISLSPPQDANVYLKRAIASSQLKDPDFNNALIDLSKVIRAYPDSFRAYCVRSQLHQQMGYPMKAGEDINQAIAIGGKSAMPYLYKGMLQEAVNEDTSALIAYTQAIQLKPDYAEAYSRRGNLLSEREQYDYALDDLNRALELDPTQADAYMHRGDLYRRIGRYQKAIEDYSQTLRFAPDKDDAYYKRGRIYALNDQYELAIDDIKRSLEINPDIGIRYAQLAKVYARMGERDLFYQYLQMALERDFPPEELRSEPSFVPYRNESRFKQLQRSFE